MIKNHLNASAISAELSEKAEAVVKHLLPQGKRHGKEWCIGSITGEQGQSLKICLEGEKKGRWSDFATKEGGDLLDLWALTRRINLSGAITEAKQWMGIASPHFLTSRANAFVLPDTTKLPASAASIPAVLTYLTQDRKLTLDTLEKFDLRATEKEIVFPYWREGKLIQVKYLGLQRPQGKKHIRVEKNAEPGLFGWQALPDKIREIALTEGEIDAMTLSQYGISALSLPFGGGAGDKHRWLECEFDRLSIFDTIYLCLDQDEVGQATVKDLVDRLGRSRCRLVTLPFKDANDCLQHGITAEYMQQLFAQAPSLDPVELKPADTFVDAVLDQFYPSEGQELGINPPWSKAIGNILFRPSELFVWTGINGHGKSQLLGHIILASLKQGAKVCIASLELRPARLLMRLTRQAAALEIPSPEYIRAIHEWYQDKLWIFDLVGIAKVDQLLSVFEYARQRYGIDVFVIDSMLKCGIAEEDLNAQKAFVEQLCDFKHLHNGHIHLIVHPRKGIDETKIPGKLDMKGSGAISDLADNCFTVWRNKTK